MDRVMAWLLSRYWKEAVKSIEKKNLVTKALEVCYKNKVLRDSWKDFVGGVIDWIDDAKDEALTAQKWTYEPPKK